MKALVYISLVKLKGQIRNVFSKPSSAIFTSLIILCYVGGFVGMLMNPEIAMSTGNINDIHMAIMVAIGFNALLVFSVLMQKQSALFFENDSFYLFTGPFARNQIMRYLMSGSILSSLLFGAISIIMLVFLGGGIGYTIPFLVLAFVILTLMVYFFVVLKDYLYLLSMQKDNMKYVGRIVVLAFVGIVVAIFGIVAFQHDFDMKVSGIAFLTSDMFYWVPIFGWGKLALISFVSQEYHMVALGSVLVFGACVGIFMVMSRYKGDFVEQAMLDAEEFTAMYKAVKQGKQASMGKQKIRETGVKFHEGAKAILSKNILLMKKTNDFFRMQDAISLAIYLGISVLLDLGFFFFCYMLVFWTFSLIQTSDFMRDLNHYQIYLIPDSPMKKLWYVLLPTLLKLWIVLTICTVIAGLIFQMDVASILQYLFMICGYAFVFMSATVLSLRILKSRSNALIENLLRMLIIVLSSVPSVLVIVAFILTGTMTMQFMNIMTIGNLAMNFIISFIILYACKGMMNGRELKSE